MTLTMRPYRGEDDYWRIRAFLRDVFLLNDRRELCWQPLDGQLIHVLGSGQVAQAVIAPYIRPGFSFVDELDETERGSGGFGSTGK